MYGYMLIDIKPYVCISCNVGFKKFILLGKHLKIHNDEIMQQHKKLFSVQFAIYLIIEARCHFLSTFKIIFFLDILLFYFIYTETSKIS